MNLNLNKKSNFKKYIINGLIIFFTIIIGTGIGQTFSNGVPTSDHEKIQTEHDNNLDELNSKKEDLHIIKTKIFTTTTELDSLKQELEAQKSN